MKKRIISLSILLFSVFTGGTQTVSNPVRKVVYTLPPHTVVYDNAFAISSPPQGNVYAAVTLDTLKGEYTLLLNGEVLARTTMISKINTEKPFPFHLCRMSLFENKDYLFAYAKNENNKKVYYINNNGVEQGPFDDFSRFIPSLHFSDEIGRAHV